MSQKQNMISEQKIIKLYTRSFKRESRDVSANSAQRYYDIKRQRSSDKRIQAQVYLGCLISTPAAAATVFTQVSVISRYRQAHAQVDLWRKLPSLFSLRTTVRNRGTPASCQMSVCQFYQAIHTQLILIDPILIRNYYSQ